MKSIALIVCGLLIVFLAPVAVSAQGMPGMPPGGPGPGGYMMPGAPMGPGPAPGGFMMPGSPGSWPFSAPQGCQPKSSDPFSFVAYGGYLYHPEGLTYTRERDASTGLPNLQFKLPTQGAWLGGFGTLPLSEKIGFVGSGGILIPSRQSGTVSEEGPIQVPLMYSITAEHDWFYLDAMGYYTLVGCGFNGLQALAGFRWDHLDSKQNLSWADAGTGGAVQNGTGTNNLKINGYLPYFGVQSVYRSCTDRVIMRAIGFPFVPGDLKFQESFVDSVDGSGGGSFTNSPLGITSGYWIEAWADASRKLADSFWLGGFVRWQYLAGKTDPTQFNVASTVGTGSFSERIIYYTRAWVFGGSLGIDFNLF